MSVLLVSGRQWPNDVERLLQILPGWFGIEESNRATFGPSGVSEEYERTRAFYAMVGFWPLEERADIWGPDNPCLISVKALD